MARALTSVVRNALDDDVIYPFFAVDMDFDSGPLYMWTGQYDKIIDGKTYLGAGQVLALSNIEETSEIEAKGATVTVTGIPSSFLSLALTEPYQGRECRIYMGVMSNPDQYVEIFTGELDQMNIMENAETSTIAITVENILIKLGRPVTRRLTSEDQKLRWPGDLGLDFVSSLQTKELFFGKTSDK